jgi:hypothetical protein
MPWKREILMGKNEKLKKSIKENKNETFKKIL